MFESGEKMNVIEWLKKEKKVPNYLALLWMMGFILVLIYEMM